MDERALADKLDRFLDELVTGDSAELRNLDPEFAGVVRRYRTFGGTPAPAGARIRVWRRLDQQANPVAHLVPPIPVASNGHERLPASLIPQTRAIGPARWRNVGYIAAAVALFALGAVSALLASDWGDEQRPNSVPAVDVPEATVAPNPSLKDSPLSFTLPAELFPPLEGGGSNLVQITIPAGASWNWLAMADPCCQALVVEYVLSGSYTIRFADDPVQVMRSDGPLQDVSAGTEISLRPGDTLISNSRFAHEGTNAGPAPVQLLRWDFRPGLSWERLMPAHWVLNAENPHYYLTDIEPGPVQMTLRQVELQVDETYEAEPGVRPDLIFAVPMNVNDAGEFVITKVADLGDGRRLNFGDEPITLYVFTLEPLDAEAVGPSGGIPDA